MKDDKFTGWRKSRHGNSSGSCVEVATANWHKSSYSNSSESCVEVAPADRRVGVRDSKQHGLGPVLEFGPTAWKAFLAAVKDGEFDL
jgi:Domain of unknown function (DUF397)